MYLKILVFLLLFSSSLFAQVMPGDVPYFVLEKDNYHFIFPEEYRGEVLKIKNAQEKIREVYERSFAWVLDEQTDLVLASNNNQIANAYASVYYNNINVYYNGGASELDRFAMRSWGLTLLSHEGAHLYQLNPKAGPSKFFHRYFGNSAAPHLFYILPIFVSPNIFLPTWLLEGNAVLNESRFGNGGRLYSGEERALFYALVRSGKLDEARLTNNHLDFPYGHEKYNVGAEFALFLATRFGIHKANQFFVQHANHYVNPFLLNASFRDHFGVTYSKAVKAFLEESKIKAAKQHVSIAPRLIEAPFVESMTQDSEKIYFLSGDGKTSNTLNTYSKKTRELETKKLDLPMGKVFEVEKDHFYSAQSGAVSQTQIKFSLWDENERDLEAFRGKIILDRRGNDILWFDPLHSFDEPALFYNDTFYDYAHSSALFDSKGHIYYFKQRGEERILMKDKKPLVSFPSYYGKLVEVDENEIPYFIASTETGSSLFCFKDEKIFRLLSSDVVVDAKRIKEGDFLVNEVGPKGYEFKVLRTAFSEEKPVSYRYFYTNDLPQKEANKNEELKARDYSLLKDLRFGGLNMMASYGSSSLFVNTFALFADPLGQNNIFLNYRRNEWSGEDQYLFQYLNKKNVLYWYLRYLRENDYAGKNQAKENKRETHDDKSSVGVLWPFFKSGLWNSSLETAISYRTERSAWVNYSSLRTTRTKNHTLDFYPYRYFSLLLENESADDKIHASAVSSEIHAAFPYGFFLHGFGLYKESTDNDMTLDKPIDESTSGVLTRGYSLYGGHKRLLKGGRLSFEVGQFFETGIYFSSFPLSLRRVAPKVIFNHYYYDLNKKRDFQERGVALDAEFLLLHLLPFKASFATLRREHDSAEFLFSLGTQTSF